MMERVYIMSTFINELISSIFQVLVFSIIPFITWLLTARKKESFFSWLGFKKAILDKKGCVIFAVGAVIVCEIVGLTLYKLILDADWNRSTSAGMGISGLPSAILNSVIQTALSEEILFRGFIQKRLQNVLNFKVATIIQSLLFGFAHIVLIM
ncbi:MAG: CPBP family intramembrane metalloprotease, partial [Butyrivibrio sp.]|nr:CPBP family intramembrane metalloprotease [Butyrivibrio sp.]